ncbi:ComEA family DNA-binding protein [Rhodococcus sp. Z13]|uniref:ComEA family DNA-binding protein n=1 Tax=Rhodococcus sacchari TaxID=2962047 RepID=A0ACD4DCA3_9NOCA|nr:ComEA family DNA-binding protein [Rhodococcus sp. Z13]UYP17599.1 ComEA family DNA-binding protein [Rhodococcus sp. Z13]
MASSDPRDLVRTRLGAIARSAEMPDIPPWTDDDRWPDAEDDPDESPSRVGILDRLAAARWDTGRRGTAALAAVGVLAAVVTLVVLWRDRPVAEPVPPLPSVEIAAPTATSETGEPEESGEQVVSVVGAVARPGLVRLAPGARVADALDAAGGALDGADLIGLNLARRVADGDQIVVGVVPLQPVPPSSGILDGGGEASGADTGGGLLDLNTADEAALDALPGVGPVTAAAIVAWRTTHGPFTDIEQLGEVDGIGPARLARLRPLVTV